eukprot:gene21650-26039_t
MFHGYYNYDADEIDLMTRCDQLVYTDAGTEYNAQYVSATCGLVGVVPLEVTYANATRNLDGGAIHRACTDAIKLLADDSSEKGEEEAVARLTEGCQDLDKFFQAFHGGSGQEMDDTVDRLTMLAEKAADLVISILNAISTIQYLLPAAVSIAPAILRGALTVKTLVPQSSLPGMFILMLPWLYCPIIWCLYSIVFQFVGNIVLLIGLLLLAFAPMINYFVGQLLRVAEPMDEQGVMRILKAIAMYTNCLFVGAYVLIMVFVVFHYSASTDEMDKTMEFKADFQESLSGFRSLCTILVSTVANYLFTTLAGADWMIGEIVAQRHFELWLETGHDVQYIVKSINRQ